MTTKSTVAKTVDKSATKSTVADTVDWFWRRIGNNLNSTACRGRHCRQLGRLCRQSVPSQSDTVHFVDFQQSRPCWIQLCRHLCTNRLMMSNNSVHLRDNCSSRRNRIRLIRTKYRWHDGRFDTGNMACFCRCECRPQISSIAADWRSSKSGTAV